MIRTIRRGKKTEGLITLLNNGRLDCSYEQIAIDFFHEMPEDVVYTVEYSVHCGMQAIYELYGVDKKIPPIYHGLTDPKVGLHALESAFR